AACVRRLSFGVCFFFFSSRRRHTRFSRDWSSDVCSSDLATSGLGVEKSEVEHCIYSVLIGEREMKEVIRSTAIDGLEVVPATIRSEERRVGKECRCRWSPDDEKEKRQSESGIGSVVTVKK